MFKVSTFVEFSMERSLRDSVLLQGCALGKIAVNLKLSIYKIQGAQHMIFMQKLSFSSCPRAKVSHQRQLGTATAQRCCIINR